MGTFNRTEYEIRKIEEIKEKTEYIIVKDGKESYFPYTFKGEAEHYINSVEAFSKVRYLPFYNLYFYCSTKEDFLNYAKHIALKFADKIYTHTDVVFRPLNYFINNADEYWHGSDWYKLNIDKEDGEIYYECLSFKDFKEERENQINEFINALNQKITNKKE